MGTRKNWMDLEQRLFYTNCTKLEKKIQTDTGITVLSLDFPTTTTIPENIPRRVYVFEDMVKERGCAKNRVTESEWLKENPHWKGAVMATLKDIGHGYLWDRHWNEFVYVPLQRAFFFVTSRKPPPIGNGVSFWLNANVFDFDERSGLEDLIAPLRASVALSQTLSAYLKQPITFDANTYEELCNQLATQVKLQRLESNRWQEIADRLLDRDLCNRCAMDKDEAYLGDDYQKAKLWRPRSCETCGQSIVDMPKKLKKDEKILLDYHDPIQPGSLGGITRFAKTHKISVDTAKKVLERDLGYTLHKPRRRRFATLPVLVFNVDQQWVADLVETQPLSKYNKGHRYLLNVIDVLSKYAWVEPLKDKTGKTVSDAFAKILKRADGRKPQNLQTDDGKEFYNKTFAALMKREGIHHFSTAGDTKASIVERFNRTLKERMYRYFTAKNTLSYLPVLQALVKGYNGSHHRSIGTSPEKVTASNERKVWERLYAKRLSSGKRERKTALKVGERVRLNKKFRTFEKGYLPGWTEEVFVIREVRPGPPVTTYKIQELDDSAVRGTFYKEDLQKVAVSDDDVFRVDKIVKRKGNKVLVHWKGWPDKYDSWIAKTALKKS
ncbi:hypothetical protein ACROYT_G002288 [Oculina patagonica]